MSSENGQKKQITKDNDILFCERKIRKKLCIFFTLQVFRLLIANSQIGEPLKRKKNGFRKLVVVNPNRQLESGVGQRHFLALVVTIDQLIENERTNERTIG